MRYKLGKKPARHVAKLHLRDYIHPRKLPTPPENFGHESLVSAWGMLGNDQAGDCAFAGPYHALQLWCAEGQKPFSVDTRTVLKAYSDVTGYDPNGWDPYTKTNPTDQGSDVHTVAEYWRTQGFTDANGTNHKIQAYLALDPKNTEQLYQALYLFDGVGIGIDCPQEYQEAFFRRQVWDTIKHPTNVGGHYILGVGSRAGLINTVTWGNTQLMTPAAYEQFNDEAYVYLDTEKLVNGKDINGFDADQLISDLADLAAEVNDEPCRREH